MLETRSEHPLDKGRRFWSAKWKINYFDDIQKSIIARSLVNFHQELFYKIKLKRREPETLNWLTAKWKFHEKSLEKPWKVHNANITAQQIALITIMLYFVVSEGNFKSIEWNNIKTVELSSVWFQLRFYDAWSRIIMRCV